MLFDKYWGISMDIELLYMTIMLSVLSLKVIYYIQHQADTIVPMHDVNKHF